MSRDWRIIYSNALTFVLIILLFITGNRPDPIMTTVAAAGKEPGLSFTLSTDVASAGEHSAHVWITASDVRTPTLTLTMHAYHGRYPIPRADRPREVAWACG